MPTAPSYHKPNSEATRRARASRDRQRGSAAARGYDRTWRRFRVWFLRRHPICEDECGCTRAAEEVHHRVALVEQPELRLVEENCQALCKAHHSRKTLAAVRRSRRAKTGRGATGG